MRRSNKIHKHSCSFFWEAVWDQRAVHMAMLTALELVTEQDKEGNLALSELPQRKWKPFRGSSLLVSRRDVQLRLTLHATRTRSLPLISYLNRSRKRKNLLCRKESLSLQVLVWQFNRILCSSNQRNNSLRSNSQHSSNLPNSSQQSNNQHSRNLLPARTTQTTMRAITTETVKTQKEAQVQVATKNRRLSSEARTPEPEHALTLIATRMNVC